MDDLQLARLEETEALADVDIHLRVTARADDELALLILRDFGGLEDFERVLIHALRRSCGQRVLLSLGECRTKSGKSHDFPLFALAFI